MAEWLKVLLSKSSELARVPWVRIPPSPPIVVMKNSHKIICSILIIASLAIAAIIFRYEANQNPKGKSMLGSIRQQLSFGPRYVGSEGHTKVQNYILETLEGSGLEVIEQNWTDTETQNKLLNILARSNPQAEDRIIIATHYDTDPTSLRDAGRANTPVPGASDGASGVAVLLELSRALNGINTNPKLGVDLVFFDAENFRPGSFDNWKPKGSSYFAGNLAKFYSKNPAQAIVVDMVCDKNLSFTKEKTSFESNPAEVDRLWEIGNEVDSGAFIDDGTKEIRDDHNPLINAGIPSTLLIDLDYPYFNTPQDTLQKCSGNSLNTTYSVLRKYLSQKSLPGSL